MFELSRLIRLCKRCNDVINVPQSGYWKGKVLFIFQNPAIPRPGKWQDDVLRDISATAVDVNIAYKSTLQNSRLGTFINDLGLKWDDISISNVVKCPTKKNKLPSRKCIDNCKNYIYEQILILKPKLIILCGFLPKNVLYKKVKDKFPTLLFYHYAYLMRIGMWKQYIKRYKEMINNCLHAEKA